MKKIGIDALFKSDEKAYHIELFVSDECTVGEWFPVVQRITNVLLNPIIYFDEWDYKVILGYIKEFVEENGGFIIKMNEMAFDMDAIESENVIVVD